MKISDEMSFIIGEATLDEDVLLPSNNDQKAEEFIVSHQAGNFDRFAKQNGRLLFILRPTLS